MKKFYSKLYKEQLRVGLFTLLILIVLVVGYLWLSNRISTRPQQELKVAFEDVVGLEVGHKVMFRGMEIGRVRAVQARSADILVICSIRRDVVLREGAVFYMATNSLMGNPLLNIDQGTGGKPLDMSRIQQGEPPVGFSKMMARGAVTLQELNAILKDLRAEQGLIAEAGQAVRSVDALAGDSRQEIAATLLRVQELTEQVKRLVEANSGVVNDVLDGTPATLANINHTLDSLQVLTAKLNTTVATLNSGQGTAGRLLNDNALYDKLTRSVAGLDSLVQDIKARPQRYVKFSLF